MMSVCKKAGFYRLFMVLLCSATVDVESTLAQTASTDSAFLACANHSDRGQRIACLEDALQAAMAARESQTAAPAPTTTASSAAATASAPAPQPAPAAAPSAQTPAAAVATPAEDQSLLDRVRAFGRGVTMSTDDSGSERLHDSITSLEKRNDLWIVTLSSGQVWRQEVPRALALRVGDDVEIYQEGFGNGYRLATPRLSGFIRVERIR